MSVVQSPPTIYPLKGNPYYFVVPRYIRTSAGIRAIYMICHWLNRLGQSAFIYTWPENVDGTTNADLLTPPVTRAVIDQHIDQGRTPIFIYTDTAERNFANADVVVRYFGHYPGHLAPLVKMTPDELHYSHSLEIAKRTQAPDNILYVPVCDTTVFHPPEKPMERKGTCYYAAKYKDLHKQVVFGIPEDSFEITRDKPGDLTPPQLGELFRRSEVLYLFEDSAIGNEAAMCGCPVVLVPNEYHKVPLGLNEVGRDGIAWGFDAEEIERATRTVDLAFQNYVKLIDGFHTYLNQFIERTQAYASTRSQSRPLIAPEENYALQRILQASAEGKPLPRKKSLKKKFEFLPILGSHFRRVRLLREKLLDVSAQKDDLSRKLTLLEMEVAGLRGFAAAARNMIDTGVDYGSLWSLGAVDPEAPGDYAFSDFLTDEITRLGALREILLQARAGGKTRMVSYRGPGLPISVSVELPPTLTTAPPVPSKPRLR